VWYLTKSNYCTASNSLLCPAKCNLAKMKALLRQDRFQPAADMEEVKVIDHMSQENCRSASKNGTVLAGSWESRSGYSQFSSETSPLC